MRYGEYDKNKGIEILRYIISKGINNKYFIMKALYFADKYHLHKYGRMVNEDHFRALELGPVPTEIYQFIRNIQYGVIPGFSSKSYFIYADKGPDMDWFSDSDIEALDFGINEVTGLSMGQVMDKSHDAGYNATDEGDIITLESMVSDFDNRDVILEYINERTF